ncbi:hypothetical protein [Micromonospora sp. NPDC126480]|uniref:hypothetical protein n=1 Tax=Micromonospora sp. NPDC126480 TaxID=3155312 RepID=UPI00332C3513
MQYTGRHPGQVLGGRREVRTQVERQGHRRPPNSVWSDLEALASDEAESEKMINLIIEERS